MPVYTFAYLDQFDPNTGNVTSANLGNHPFTLSLPDGSVLTQGQQVSLLDNGGVPVDAIYSGRSASGELQVQALPQNGGAFYIFTNTVYNPVPVFSPDDFPCYLRGTRILTAAGDVAVEDLRIGDLIVTASGAQRPIKWIGTRAYDGRFANTNSDVLPICFKAGSLDDNMPKRDLWVSPKHAMFLEGVLIPASALLNGVTVVQAERVESVEYFHVELDTHDVLLAEGAPAESFVADNGRGIFHNGQEFDALYPEALPEAAAYCAPRVEGGYALESVRRRLAERAGLAVSPARCFGELHGRVEGCDGAVVWGWAQDTLYPDAPVCLDVVVDGVVVAHSYADRFRADLAASGIGDGRHGFELHLPAPLAPASAGSVEVRRSADGAPLHGRQALAA